MLYPLSYGGSRSDALLCVPMTANSTGGAGPLVQIEEAARAGGTVGVSPLVTTEWLTGQLDDPTVRVADIRWYLPSIGKQGREEYDRGHIPGAVFVDLETELANHGAFGPGRHPLPAAETFGDAMSRAGIGPATHVVAYDDNGGSIAARLWWLLRAHGHARVSVLDGGITKWTAEGRPIETQARSYARAAFAPGELGRHVGHVVDKAQVRRLLQEHAVVLDARATERYEGSTEPVDARAGHIPGARSAPFSGNLTQGSAGSTQIFLTPEALRERFASLGVTRGKPVVAYCGSGVTACHNLLALHLAGFSDAVLYEGSWSDWSRDSSLPIATGPDTGPASSAG